MSKSTCLFSLHASFQLEKNGSFHSCGKLDFLGLLSSLQGLSGAGLHRPLEARHYKLCRCRLQNFYNPTTKARSNSKWDQFLLILSIERWETEMKKNKNM